MQPFTSAMVLTPTPGLRRMASNGMMLTNFHTASPICSPSRASIMTGLFPWRMGIDFIYDQDLKLDGTQELDHEELPLIPNLAITLHDAGYYTAHIGKWHLGGMNIPDITNRSMSGDCTTPGINQYGFDEVGYKGKTNPSTTSYYPTLQTLQYLQYNTLLYYTTLLHYYTTTMHYYTTLLYTKILL